MTVKRIARYGEVNLNKVQLVLSVGDFTSLNDIMSRGMLSAKEANRVTWLKGEPGKKGKSTVNKARRMLVEAMHLIPFLTPSTTGSIGTEALL